MLTAKFGKPSEVAPVHILSITCLWFRIPTQIEHKSFMKKLVISVQLDFE